MKREHIGCAGEVRELGGPLRTLARAAQPHRLPARGDRRQRRDRHDLQDQRHRSACRAEHAPIGPAARRRRRPVRGLRFLGARRGSVRPDHPDTRKPGAVPDSRNWPGPAARCSAGCGSSTHASVRTAMPIRRNQSSAAPDERSFSLRSASSSNVWKFDARMAPERGAQLRRERAPDIVRALRQRRARRDRRVRARRPDAWRANSGNNLDVALQWKSGRAPAACRRVQRALLALHLAGGDRQHRRHRRRGAVRPSSFPEYAFRSVRARLHGVEIEGRHRLLDEAVDTGCVGQDGPHARQ